MNNFLITASGRSGTTFLSTVMNKSSIWSVKHEPQRSEKLSIAQIQKRFNQNYYGEVNAFLCSIADEIKVKKKGVILRDPIELWISIANRYQGKNLIKHLNDLEAIIFKMLYYSLKKDEYLTISFKKMTNDKNYLQNIINYFEVKDVKITEGILKEKINASTRHDYYSLEQFNNNIQSRVRNLKNKTEALGEKI